MTRNSQRRFFLSKLITLIEDFAFAVKSFVEALVCAFSGFSADCFVGDADSLLVSTHHHEQGSTSSLYTPWPLTVDVVHNFVGFEGLEVGLISEVFGFYGVDAVGVFDIVSISSQKSRKYCSKHRSRDIHFGIKTVFGFVAVFVETHETELTCCLDVVLGRFWLVCNVIEIITAWHARRRRPM